MTDQLTPESDAESVAVRHDLAHVPMVDPAAKGGLIGVLRRRYLLRLMVKRELRARYIGSKMGLAWSYINPFTRFLTFYFVFGIILGRGQVPHFAIHLFAGMVVVNLFTESFNSGTRSIMQNKSIVQKMPLPREIFPISSMLVSLYHTGPQLVILIGACLITGSFAPDPMGMLAAVMAFIIVILLGTGMGLMFSAINVMYRDWTRRRADLHQHAALHRADDVPLHAGRAAVRELPRHLPPLPVQPDHRGGAAHAARVLDHHDQPGRRRRGEHGVRLPARSLGELPAAPVPARRDLHRVLDRVPGVRPVGVQPAGRQDPRQARVMVVSSIEVEKVSKQFNMRYQRTLKQMIVAKTRGQKTSDERSGRSRT